MSDCAQFSVLLDPMEFANSALDLSQKAEKRSPNTLEVQHSFASQIGQETP